MQFALYRYEFEVMEKKDSSATLFPDQWDNLSPRQAFERKSELLDELLEKDYQMINRGRERSYDDRNAIYFGLPNDPSFGRAMHRTESTSKKALLLFTKNHKKPLAHKYVFAPKDGFTILQLAKLSSVSHRPHPFLTNAVKEDDYKSLHVIIDNRGTHQRVAIEEKPSVLSTDAVAASLASTFSDAFARYGLNVKVVPIRDDKHFWKIVNDRKRFPQGFKRLCVVFPQINDEELSERMRRVQMEYRDMFHSNLTIKQEAPHGESLNFDEKDKRQQEYVNICTENADSITLSPIGGRPFTLGGKTAKTQQMSEQERKSIEEGYKQQELFESDPVQSTKTFMDKAYN